jgi:hypothetical protein
VEEGENVNGIGVSYFYYELPRNKPTGLHEVGESQAVMEAIHGCSFASGFTFRPRIYLTQIFIFPESTYK